MAAPKQALARPLSQLIAAGLLVACTLPGTTPLANAPAPAADCREVALTVAGLWLQAQDCRLSTGHWRVLAEPALPGLALWRDGDRQATVLQVFTKPADAPVSDILPALRAGGHIPDDDDCQPVPASPAPAAPAAPATQTRYEIRPFGARLRALQATPADQVPNPPCGAYGWSTHGVRYLLLDQRRPDRVLYLDEGQDGTLIQPVTLRWD